MPSPEAGATTPAASPARMTSLPLSQRFRGFSGIGAPSLRIVPTRLSCVSSRRAWTEPLSEKPLLALPVPTLIVSPCGKIQA